MDYSVEKMNCFKVIGFVREFQGDTSLQEIPKFWDEINENYGKKLMQGKAPENDTEKAFAHHRVGEYGVCIDNIGKPGHFKYMIAGKYMGGDVPKGMDLLEIPEQLWAKFRSIGAIPDALQNMTKQIWTEWLPGNNEYELDGDISIEWYSPSGTPADHDYQTAVWLPVKKIVNN